MAEQGTRLRAAEQGGARPRRLFAAELAPAGGELELSADAVHHVRVLRLEPGDRVELFDGRLGQAGAELVEVTRDRVRCRVEPRVLLQAPAPALHVVLGLPKGGKLEDIARMLAELGVNALHLALCERSVPRPSDSAARMARLARVLLEACAQSGQALAPELHAPRSLLEVCAGGVVGPRTRGVVFWERGERELDAVLPAGCGASLDAVWVVIGPEGGLDEREVEALAARGFAVVGLGAGILRVETAAPVAAALVLDRMGRLRG